MRRTLGRVKYILAQFSALRGAEAPLFHVCVRFAARLESAAFQIPMKAVRT